MKFGLHPHDHCCAPMLSYNNCAETHLGVGVMRHFVLSLAAVKASCKLPAYKQPGNQVSRE